MTVAMTLMIMIATLMIIMAIMLMMTMNEIGRCLYYRGWVHNDAEDDDADDDNDHGNDCDGNAIDEE